MFLSNTPKEGDRGVASRDWHGSFQSECNKLCLIFIMKEKTLYNTYSCKLRPFKVMMGIFLLDKIYVDISINIYWYILEYIDLMYNVHQINIFHCTSMLTARKAKSYHHSSNPVKDPSFASAILKKIFFHELGIDIKGKICALMGFKWDVILGSKK